MSQSRLVSCYVAGSDCFKDEVDLLILNATFDFVLPENRFDESLYLLQIHGCFSFIHNYIATIIQCFVLWFLRLFLFFIYDTHNGHGVRWLNAYCVNTHSDIKTTCAAGYLWSHKIIYGHPEKKTLVCTFPFTHYHHSKNNFT